MRRFYPLLCVVAAILGCDPTTDAPTEPQPKAAHERKPSDTPTSVPAAVEPPPTVPI